MQKSAKDLPHYIAHIQANWPNYKSCIASKLKPLIIPLCRPLTEEEDQGFAKWLHN